jgi:hypothetical protein
MVGCLKVSQLLCKETMMIRRILLAISAVFLTTYAQAATIGFEAQDGSWDRFPRSFVEDGVRVSYTPTSEFGFALIDDPADHLGMCSPACTSNGTTAFYSFNQGSITFSLENGGLFSLASLDAAQTWIGYDSPLTLTLTGTGADGVVTRTISAGAEQAEAFSTYMFSDLVNLSSLTITGGPEFSEFAIDNVILSPAAVPEPASWTMLIAGFGIVGGALRRRRLAVRLA